MKRARVIIILFSILLLIVFLPGCGGSGGGGGTPSPEGGGGGETSYRYSVYGGDTYVQGEEGYYPKIEENGYVLLGSSDGSDSFTGGDYDYYAVVVKGEITICVDTVMVCGSSCSYPGSSTTGNTFDHQNIGGEPDGKVAVIGNGNGGGYILIVSKIQDDYITLYCPDL